MTSALNILDIKFDVCSESRAFIIDRLFSSENWIGDWFESMFGILKARLMAWELILQMNLVPSTEIICLEEGA